MTPLFTFRKLSPALALTISSLALGDNQKDDSQKPTLLRASTIMGMNVTNLQGEKLGDIDNLAIESTEGRCRYAIMSRGGVAGLGDTHVAVPWKALKFANDAVRLDVTKQRFDQAPTFDDDKNWSTIGDPQWATTVHQYYSLKPDFKTRTNDDPSRNPPPTFFKGSDAVGMDIHNRQGDDLGELEDVMIDVNSGRVAYAVLGFGGVLGMGEKLFAVPWQSLSFNSQEKMFVLNVDKDKLKTAPGFDKNQWPDMTDVRWSKDVHTFYGSDPNWIYGYSGDGSRNAGGWGANDDYNRMFKKDSVQTFKGFVHELGAASPMPGMDEGAQLTIQTDRETLTVHMGPQWFMERQEYQFNKGEQIEVTGSRVEINGQPVVLATEIKRGKDTLRLREKNGRPCWVAWHTDED
jgi:sporulation protein YlmC with PRC-barrel domain